MIDLAIEMGAKSISTYTKYSEKLVKYFLDNGRQGEHTDIQ